MVITEQMLSVDESGWYLLDRWVTLGTVNSGAPYVMLAPGSFVLITLTPNSPDDAIYMHSA